MDSIEFILAANSPGELSSLVKPIAEKLRAKSTRAFSARITLFLTPCQYSSGREMDFVKTLPVDQVVTAEDYRKWILGIPIKNEPKFKYKGVVLYLGGDLLHAVLIAKKLGYKVYAYLHGQKAGWKSVFSKFFVQDEKARKKLLKSGFADSRVKVAGDLMMNSINALPKKEAIKIWKLNPHKPIIAMLPGSRQWEIEFMLPFYEEAGVELKKILPEIQLLLVISPFTPIEEIELKIRENVFDLLAPLSSIAAADLAVTIPGTNTAQIASLGIPTLTIFPLNKIDDIPMNGLFYYLTKIPLLGKVLKRGAAEAVSRNTKFFALPNIKAQRMIAPEMKGILAPEQVVEKILTLIKNPEYLKQMGAELRKIMGESNAAEIITEEIINENLPAAV